MNMQDAIRSKEEVEVDDEEEEEGKGRRWKRDQDTLLNFFIYCLLLLVLSSFHHERHKFQPLIYWGTPTSLSFFLLLSFPLPIFPTFSLITTVLVVGTATATSGSSTFLKINRTL